LEENYFPLFFGDSSEPNYTFVFMKKAFEDLYHEHFRAVLRFAMSVTGRRDTAEDLTTRGCRAGC
jgi:hypothetical protein